MQLDLCVSGKDASLNVSSKTAFVLVSICLETEVLLGDSTYLFSSFPVCLIRQNGEQSSSEGFTWEKKKKKINLHCRVSGCNVIMLAKLKKEMFRAHRNFRRCHQLSRWEKFVCEHSAVPELTQHVTQVCTSASCRGGCKIFQVAHKGSNSSLT